MLDLPVDTHSPARTRPAPDAVLPAELDFYEAYDWCLNPHLRVGEAMSRLAAEIARFEAVPEGWQTGEVAANVYLLACGILNCADEYLRGPSLRLPGRLGKTGLARAGGRLIEAASALNWRRLRQVRGWRERVGRRPQRLSQDLHRRRSGRCPHPGRGRQPPCPPRAGPASRGFARALSQRPLALPPPRHEPSRRPRHGAPADRAPARPLGPYCAGGPAHLRLLFRPAHQGPARNARLCRRCRLSPSSPTRAPAAPNAACSNGMARRADSPSWWTIPPIPAAPSTAPSRSPAAPALPRIA